MFPPTWLMRDAGNRWSGGAAQGNPAHGHSRRSGPASLSYPRQEYTIMIKVGLKSDVPKSLNSKGFGGIHGINVLL